MATTTAATPIAAPVGLVAVGLARELRHGQLAALLVLVQDGGRIGLVHRHLLGLLLLGLVVRLLLGLVVLLLGLLRWVVVLLLGLLHPRRRLRRGHLLGRRRRGRTPTSLGPLLMLPPLPTRRGGRGGSRPTNATGRPPR